MLHLVGTLDRPDSGSVEIDGSNPFALSEPELARFRNTNIGFVFQDHCLLPQCSVLENVLVPTLAEKNSPTTNGAEQRAERLLKRVGLSDRMQHRPERRHAPQADAEGDDPLGPLHQAAPSVETEGLGLGPVQRDRHGGLHGGCLAWSYSHGLGALSGSDYRNT